jgi:hypothetical protein
MPGWSTWSPHQQALRARLLQVMMDNIARVPGGFVVHSRLLEAVMSSESLTDIQWHTMLHLGELADRLHPRLPLAIGTPSVPTGLVCTCSTPRRYEQMWQSVQQWRVPSTSAPALQEDPAGSPT